MDFRLDRLLRNLHDPGPEASDGSRDLPRHDPATLDAITESARRVLRPVTPRADFRRQLGVDLRVRAAALNLEQAGQQGRAFISATADVVNPGRIVRPWYRRTRWIAALVGSVVVAVLGAVAYWWRRREVPA